MIPRLLKPACWLLLFWLAASPPAWAGQLPLLVGSVERINLNPYLSHLADPTGSLTLALVQPKAFAPLQAQPHAVAYSFGFSQQTHWLRLRFATNAQPGQILLQQTVTHLQECEVWLMRKGDNFPTHYDLGSLTPAPDRAFPHETRIQQLPLAPNEDYELLIRAKSFQTVDFQFTLWQENAFLRYDHPQSIRSGLFYGGIFLMLLYHLMLTLRLKDPAYLFYSLYLGLMAFNIGIMQGYAQQYLWPAHGIWNAWAFVAARILGFVFVAQFVGYFLHLQERQPRLHRLSLYAQVAMALSVPMAFFLPYPVLQGWINLVMLIGLLLLLQGTLANYRAGYKEALHLASGLALYFFFILVLLFRQWGLTPQVYLDVAAVKVALFANVTLFSLALADRVAALQRERETAQQALVQETQRHAQELETKVQTRTVLLQAALHEAEVNHHQMLATQAQMVQAEKMASLGGLVAGVAHEINNPTGAIHLNAYNLQRDLAQLHDQLLQMAEPETDAMVLQELQQRFGTLKQEVDHIQDASTRIKNIVSDLRAFSRLNESERTKADLAANLESTLRLIRTQYSEQVAFHLDLQARPQLDCWPAQLNQVFMNLLVNACQAILATGCKGNLTIRSWIHNNELALSFQDDGCGMTPETQKKMFDPFFTTKEVGQGTGLGLSISFGIVKHHQGRFEVVSAPGQGTNITLWLPLSAPQAA